MTNRRAFCRTVAGAAGALVLAPPFHAGTRSGGASSSHDRRPAREGHRHPLPLRHPGSGGGRQEHAAGQSRWWRRRQPGAGATAPGAHGQDRCRRAGAHHQRLLVVCSRSRSRAEDRAGAERRPREVGQDAPGSICRDGLRCAAVSRSRRAAARGRRQASRICAARRSAAT